MKIIILASSVILASCLMVPEDATAQRTSRSELAVRSATVHGDANTANSPCSPDASIHVDGGGCYSTVQAALSALPSTGGTLLISAGTYACPDDIIGKSNIQLIGQTYDPPASTGHGINSSWLDHADRKVVFQCRSTWTIDSSNGLVLQGIQMRMMPPQSGDGLVVKAVTNSKFSNFSIVGQGSGQAGVGLHIFGLGTMGTNSSRNTFQDFLISGFNSGSISLTGSSASAHCVTLNDFRNYWLTSGASPTGPAISTSYCSDSNYWYNGTLTNLGSTQNGLTINYSGDPTTDQDAGGNVFFGITVQPADPGYYTGHLFQFNQSHGTLIDGASITGGLSGNINGKIVGMAGSPQFRICFASNFAAPPYSSSCIDQLSYLGLNDSSGSSDSIGSTTLFSVPSGVPGFYRVYGEMWTNAKGTGSVTFTVSSDVGGFNAEQNSPALSLKRSEALSFSFDVFAAGGSNIIYRTSYTPSGSYGLRLRIAYELQGN
jgi:hypothetical protein